jgi:hypothetical protein
MEEWQKPGGHPCVPYFDHWEAENQRKSEEYRKALDSLIRNKPKLKIYYDPEMIQKQESTNEKVSSSEDIHTEKPAIEELSQSEDKESNRNKKRIIKILIILGIIGAMSYFIYLGFQIGKLG